MRFSSLLAVAGLASSSLAQSYAPNYGPQTPGTFANATVFTPPADYTVPRTLYARTLLLNQHCERNNVLLATWENYRQDNDSFPYFPIYQSYDGGKTWSERAKVYDQVNGWGLRYQPFLYELAEPIGSFAAGDILLAGNSIPNDLSLTQIDLYVSRDQGYTWKFVSHIAKGGEAIPDNGLTPVWEPFLMMYNGQMVAYYSDQRDPAHGQKLVHQVSSDLLNWGPVVDDVAYSTYDFRPGMTTVSQLPFGNYIMTYEFYGAVEGPFSIYYRISTDPLNFNASEGHVIQATDGSIPVSSPYNVWSPAGGPLGTIAVSCGTFSEIFLNHNLGAPGAWTKVATPEGISYTRSLLVLPDQNELLITGGGQLGGLNNSVTASAVDITPVAPQFAKCNNQRRRL